MPLDTRGGLLFFYLKDEPPNNGELEKLICTSAGYDDWHRLAPDRYVAALPHTMAPKGLLVKPRRPATRDLSTF